METKEGIVQDKMSTRPISYRPLLGRVSLSLSREVGYFQALSLWTLCFFALGPRSRLSTTSFTLAPLCISRMDLRSVTKSQFTTGICGSCRSSNNGRFCGPLAGPNLSSSRCYSPRPIQRRGQNRSSILLL